MVQALDAFTAKEAHRRAAQMASRARVLDSESLGYLTRLLDSATADESLPAPEIEGLAALALAFQHGVRPVQMIALRLEHVRFFKDASDEWACVISFHAAKQGDGKAFEIPRQVKPEWVPLLLRLQALALSEKRTKLFRSVRDASLALLMAKACERQGFEGAFNFRQLRHTAAQALADAGHDRTSIQRFLGHARDQSAGVYVRASLSQAELVNTALGASKLYKNLLSLAGQEFVSIEELERASEDSQIGAVVGERLVAGVGLCRTGQSSCRFNPVTSCYGCSKFMPSLDKDAHLEAVSGMREQVIVYIRQGITAETPAYRQLTQALSGAQQALDAIERLQGEYT